MHRLSWRKDQWCFDCNLLNGLNEELCSSLLVLKDEEILACFVKKNPIHQSFSLTQRFLRKEWGTGSRGHPEFGEATFWGATPRTPWWQEDAGK